jgi:hypothetical protein
MKPTQNTVIHGLLGAAVLIAVVLLYLILSPTPNGQLMLSPSGWIVFGGAALALVLAAFLPSLVRRWRGLPPPQVLSPSDIRFCIMVVVVGCALAFVGALSEMWWLAVLPIMLAPLSIVFRFAARRQRDEKS